MHVSHLQVYCGLCASVYSDTLHTYSYDYAFDAIAEYINSMSFNIFLSWLKVFKYLRFVPFMRVLVSALGDSLAQVILIVGILYLRLARFWS